MDNDDIDKNIDNLAEEFAKKAMGQESCIERELLLDRKEAAVMALQSIADERLLLLDKKESCLESFDSHLQEMSLSLQGKQALIDSVMKDYESKCAIISELNAEKHILISFIRKLSSSSMLLGCSYRKVISQFFKGEGQDIRSDY